MKKAIYILYTICVLMVVSFFVYVCVDSRDEVFSARKQSECQYLSAYKKTKVYENASTELPLGLKTEYVMRQQEIPDGGESLMFYTLHQNVEVYIDDELVYKMKPAENNTFGKTPGNTWNIIPIYGKDSGKEIKVVLIPVYESSVYIIPDFYFGSEIHIWLQIVHDNLLPFCLSLLAIIFGIIFIIFVACNYRNPKVDKSLMMMGMFSFNIGLWKLTDIDGISLVFPQSIAKSNVPFLALLLVVIPFVLYIKKLFVKESKIWYLPCIASVVVMVVSIILQLYNIKDLRQTLWMNHLVMGMLLVIGVVMLIRELYQVGWNSKLKMMMFCLGACLLGMVADMFIYYISHGASVTVMGMLGFLVYIIILGVQSVREAKNLMDIGIQAERFEKMAYHDQLTGMYNRAAYADYTGQASFKLNGSVVMMCDLNNLKHCNDTWGHEKGDIYISSSADILQEVFGKVGKCYRVGGDEFCVLLREVSTKRCEQFIEELKRKAREWNRNSTEKFEIQIACGYAVYDKKIDYDLGDTLRRADRMMYHEKFMMKQEGK